MKLIMILAASLLPFLHETRYPAEVKGCDAQGVTLSAEGELFHAELFNVTYAEEDGWQDACAILAEADEVSFEVDPLVSLEEPLPVTGIGVAFALNDTRGLDEQLTKTFAAMRADGTMKQIVGKYLPDPEKYLEVDAFEP